MSDIRVNNIVAEGGTSAPSLVYGAQVPTGMGITGAGGINVTGVCTAGVGTFTNIYGTLNGAATGLSGTPDITVDGITDKSSTEPFCPSLLIL